MSSLGSPVNLRALHERAQEHAARTQDDPLLQLLMARMPEVHHCLVHDPLIDGRREVESQKERFRALGAEAFFAWFYEERSPRLHRMLQNCQRSLETYNRLLAGALGEGGLEGLINQMARAAGVNRSRVLELCCGDCLALNGLLEGLSLEPGIVLELVGYDFLADDERVVSERGSLETRRVNVQYFTPPAKPADIALCFAGLFYCLDPVSVVENLCNSVKVGGIVAFNAVDYILIEGSDIEWELEKVPGWTVIKSIGTDDTGLESRTIVMQRGTDTPLDLGLKLAAVGFDRFGFTQPDYVRR